MIDDEAAGRAESLGSGGLRSQSRAKVRAPPPPGQPVAASAHAWRQQTCPSPRAHPHLP
jgi:hypothetical protein